MSHRMKSIDCGRGSAGFVAAVLTVAALALAPWTAAAQTPNTCASGKIKCTNAFAATAFKCVGAVYKKAPSAESFDKAEECVRKARRKFGTAVSNKPGCFEKLDAKQDVTKPETVCPMGGDEYELDDIVKDFTEDMQEEVAPVGVSPVGSSCDAGKFKCVGAFFKKVLGCHEKAHKKGLAVDPECVAKAVVKFSGGGDPTKGCFAKLEAKQKLSKLKSLCGSDSNSAIAGGKAEMFVEDVIGAITH